MSDVGKGAYDSKFFAEIREGCQRSAATAVPIILEAIGHLPASVLDVGCGEGWWGRAFQEAGATVLGLDGGQIMGDTDAGIERRSIDLVHEFAGIEQHDLVVCLEVAEHLPPERAASFVAELTTLAPLVLFSAAMPGQGGTGHVNCQPPQYWADLFELHDYACSGALRWPLWRELDVEPWYRSNLLLFVDRGARDRDGVRHVLAGPLFDAGWHTEPLHVVAPDLWISLPAGR